MKASDNSMYPVFLWLKGEKCLIVGGGKVAGRKAAPLCDAGARVTLVAPEATDKVRALAQDGRIEWEQREYRDGEAADYFLVVAATCNHELNSRVSRDAVAAGRLINAVDMPSLCNFFVPSVVRRGGLQVAISTSGACPALAAKIRADIEPSLPESYARLVEELRAFRENVIKSIESEEERKKILERAVRSDEVKRFLEGDETALDGFFKL